MAHMRCEYIDIEEAMDMYNLDIEECRSTSLEKQYNPMHHLVTLEPPEEVCIGNNIQKRETTFQISIKNLQIKIHSNALMDTGATRSCMNYSTAYKLGKDQIKQFNEMQVVGVDSSDLGAVGTLRCTITI